MYWFLRLYSFNILFLRGCNFWDVWSCSPLYSICQNYFSIIKMLKYSWANELTIDCYWKKDVFIRRCEKCVCIYEHNPNTMSCIWCMVLESPRYSYSQPIRGISGNLWCHFHAQNKKNPQTWACTVVTQPSVAYFDSFGRESSLVVVRIRWIEWCITQLVK